MTDILTPDAPAAPPETTAGPRPRRSGRLHISVPGAARKPITVSAGAVIAGGATAEARFARRAPPRRPIRTAARPIGATSADAPAVPRAYSVEPVSTNAPLLTDACVPGDIVFVGDEIYTVVRRTSDRIHLLATAKTLSWDPTRGRSAPTRH